MDKKHVEESGQIKRSVISSFSKPNGELRSVYFLVEHIGSKGNYWRIPKWAMWLGGIGAAFILLLIITSQVVVYFAPRPGLYNETCAARSCFTQLKLKCINKICDCLPNNYYASECVPKKSYSENCNHDYQCRDNTNMSCLNGVCACDSNYYFNGVSCVVKSTLKGACTSDSMCLPNKMLICHPTKKVCYCNSARFWNGYGCPLRQNGGEKCTLDLECTDGFICVNSSCHCGNPLQYWDINLLKCVDKHQEFETCYATDNCHYPMTCNNTQCVCPPNQYHNLVTFSCLPQKLMNQTCTKNNTCRNDLNLYCSGGICVCNSPTPKWSVERTKCILPETYSYTCGYTSDCDTTKLLFCNSGAENCTCPTTSQIGMCDCPRTFSNEYYWDGTTCAPALTHNDSCTDSYKCGTITEGLYCIGSNCDCPSLQFYNTTASKCEDQYLNNVSCISNDTCRTDLGLSCIGNLCICANATLFWNDIKCVSLATYSEGCITSINCMASLICQTSTNSCKCPKNLTIGKCDCPRQFGNETYWDGSLCQPAIAYGDICTNKSTSYMCRILTENTICNGSVCTCGTYKFLNGTVTQCQDQFLNNVACSADYECRVDLGLTCQNNKCLCNNATQYWNGSRCINYSTYNQACTVTNNCVPSSSLICQTSATSCNCPTAVSINKCDCTRAINNEFYWNGTKCVPAASYGQSCQANKNYTCKTLTEKTYCNSSGICDCLNGVLRSGVCVSCQTGYTIYQGICYFVSTVKIDGVKNVVTSTSIKAACGGVATAKLAVVTSSLINFIFSLIPADDDNTRYYIDGFLVSGTTYKSVNGTWTYDASYFCSGAKFLFRRAPVRNVRKKPKEPASPGDCLSFYRNTVVTDACYEGHSCHGHEPICQYTL